jgi:hypothetical protein
MVTLNITLLPKNTKQRDKNYRPKHNNKKTNTTNNTLKKTTTNTASASTLTLENSIHNLNTTANNNAVKRMDTLESNITRILSMLSQLQSNKETTSISAISQTTPIEL